MAEPRAQHALEHMQVFSLSLSTMQIMPSNSTSVFSLHEIRNNDYSKFWNGLIEIFENSPF